MTFEEPLVNRHMIEAPRSQSAEKQDCGKALSVEINVAGALEVEVLPVLSEAETHALDQGEKEFRRSLRVTAEPDAPITLNLHSIKGVTPAAVFKNAVDELASGESIAIECHGFVLKCVGMELHVPDSLLIRNLKVAEAGGAASIPGGGLGK